jgi:hypothetical protein
MVEGFCRDCGKIKKIKGRGLCQSDYDKRNRRGTLGVYPRRPLVIERFEEFLVIHRRSPWLTSKDIAQRIGVTYRTIDRYRAHLKGTKKIHSIEAVGL